jgi:hypothetical protein
MSLIALYYMCRVEIYNKNHEIRNGWSDITVRHTEK